MSLGEAESRPGRPSQRIPFPQGNGCSWYSGMGGAFSFAMIFGGDSAQAPIACEPLGQVWQAHAATCYAVRAVQACPAASRRSPPQSPHHIWCCILLCQALAIPTASHAIIGLRLMDPYPRSSPSPWASRDFRCTATYLSGTIAMIDARCSSPPASPSAPGLVLGLYSSAHGVVRSHDFSHQFPDRGADGPVPCWPGTGTLSFCHPVRLPPPELPTCALVGAMGWFRV